MKELSQEERFRLKLWADILLIMHAFWVFLLLGGTVYMFFNHNYIIPHLVIILGTVAMNALLDGCPLTWMEMEYRKKVDKDFKYIDNSFAATYVNKFCGASMTDHQIFVIQIVIGIFSVGSAFLLLYF